MMKLTNRDITIRNLSEKDFYVNSLFLFEIYKFSQLYNCKNDSRISSSA